ncbi:MAG TPA: hypothetical protein VFB80_09075, partial [Pirellulaceae bacterium]|nr:hypothetical protein [Pirellulaceae bacterium]
EVGTAGAGATTFIDTNPDGQGVPAGTYYYRVEAFAPGLPDSAFSNVDSVRFAAPGLPLTIDHSEGFASHGDLTTSGSTTIFPQPAPVGTFLGHQDLGGVAAPGTATFDGGLYTLRASGSDIWDVADSFQYVYKPLAGDGTIEARVVGVQNTDFWAKAGLMIRENLRANSKNAFMFATPPGHDEPVFQFRADTGGFSADYGNHISGLQAAPVWLRLVRQGNSFSGFWAQDLGGGMHGPWNQIGQDTTINMAGTVYVGLALTAHNNSGVLNTSTFDHVTITGATAPLPPTVVELTDGGFGEAGGAFLSNRVGIEDFTSTFTFQITPGTSPMADGLAFVIQGLGPTALGPTGGGLGYGSDFVGGGGGLGRSLAIKFDIFNNSGEGINSTGIFTNGRSPTVRQPGLAGGFPDTSINLDGTGINLASTHPFRVTLSYDGRALTETITDTVTSATFTTNYVVNIAALVGSDVGYVGFTGGTGGLSAVQQIQSWIFETTIAKHEVQPQLAAGGPAAPGDVSALTEAELALVAQEAVARWAASGLSPAQVAQLQSVQYHIGALGGGVLGLTELGSSVVTLDATAGGYGWFVGPGLPGDAAFDDVVAPEEFHAGSDSPAFGRMDLLTVVAHELGHVLGLSDLDPQVAPHDLLTETLAPGVRRLPGSSIEVLSPTIVLASDALLFLSTMPQAIAASDQQQPSIVTLNSPLAVNPYVEDEFARALVWAAQTSELEWLRAVPSDYNDADDARAELFAQLGDQKEFLDLFGDELES